MAKFLPVVGAPMTIRCGLLQLSARVDACTYTGVLRGSGPTGSTEAALSAYYSVRRSDGAPAFTEERIAREGGMCALVLGPVHCRGDQATRFARAD